MIYKQFGKQKLSALGMGMMRLPTIGGNDSQIDEALTKKMIDYAIEHGVNYFDTAWGYHGGASELMVGKFLSEHKRDTYCLADKFPGYDLSNMPKVKEIFNKQLEKCRTEYFDFYLFHNVCEMNINEYLNTEYGVYDYLIKMRDEGKIKHLGFSDHGDLPVLERFLKAYGKDMEFCQIQLNWLDYEFQNAKGKLKMLEDYGIPVWVMEPVRGGKLASLSPEMESKLKAMRDIPTVEWAFRFLQTIKQVAVTLSGMSNFEQLKQNIEIFNTEEPLEVDEWNTLIEFGREMTGKKSLPCTACRYCTSKCPKGIDIPEIIKLYNEHNFSEGGFLAPMALSAIDAEKLPSACIACGRCQAVCPQKIQIPAMMKEFAQKLK